MIQKWITCEQSAEQRGLFLRLCAIGAKRTPSKPKKGLLGVALSAVIQKRFAVLLRIILDIL